MERKQPETDGEDVFCVTCGEPHDMLQREGHRIRWMGQQTCYCCKANGYDVEVKS